MDRAELIAGSWKSQYAWSRKLDGTHWNLHELATRVVRAIENTHAPEATVNKAVLACCGVEEPEPQTTTVTEEDRTPYRATKAGAAELAAAAKEEQSDEDESLKTAAEAAALGSIHG